MHTSRYGVQVLFAAFVLASPVGLLMALLPEAAYSFYEEAPERLWGLSPLTDQQLAGVTMTSEQAVVFFAASAATWTFAASAPGTLAATSRWMAFTAHPASVLSKSAAIGRAHV